jgi:hypothetical protein
MKNQKIKNLNINLENVHFVVLCFIALSCPSFRPSICLCICPSAWNKSFKTGRIFMKFDI